MVAALIVAIIVIISIATYATVASNQNESTYVSCTQTTSTYTPQEITFVVPSPEACAADKISLSGFLLTSSGTSYSLHGTITVDSQSPLTGFIVYFNGTHAQYSGAASSSSSQYSIQYNGGSSRTVPIVPAKNYSVEVVALFQDGTGTIASTQVSVARS
jgi:hypothetical protein